LRFNLKLDLVRKLQIIFLLLLFASCKKQDDIFRQNLSDRVILSLHYQNKDGQNLLQHSWSASDIDMLDLSQQGHKIYVQNSQGTNSIQVETVAPYGQVVRLPFANGIKIGNKMTKFLQYKDHSEDKITIEEKYEEGKAFISKIWLNDILIDSALSADHLFKPIVILK
jgi:hypothetical protein